MVWVIVAGMTALCTFSFQIGKMKGYDQCDTENQAFQKGLKKHG